MSQIKEAIKILAEKFTLREQNQQEELSKEFQAASDFADEIVDPNVSLEEAFAKFFPDDNDPDAGDGSGSDDGDSGDGSTSD